MAISSITASQPYNIAAEPAVAREKPPQSKAAPPLQDTIELSKAALAALQPKPVEATETLTQTINEAARGDPKALAKLAKK